MSMALYSASSVASTTAWKSAETCSFPSSCAVGRGAFGSRRTSGEVEKAST
jgi:hypothetical protein